jgi:nucleoside-diphosphate-sugar epimerase
VVHVSSSAVFGIPETNPVLPSTIPSPVEAYGHAKLAAERACLESVSKGLDVTIVRPRTILGHGRLGIFGILFDWIADGADVFVLGKGDNVYQFVHADDLARLCIAARRRLASTSSTPAPTASARWARRSPTSASTPARGPSGRCRRAPGCAHAPPRYSG